MKTIFRAFALVVLCFIANWALTFNLKAQAAGGNIDSVGYLNQVKCTVQIVAEKHVLVPVDTQNARYNPTTELPAKYQKPNLEVTVTGVIGSIPPNVRAIGTPLLVRSIYAAGEEPNPAQKKTEKKKKRRIGCKHKKGKN